MKLPKWTKLEYEALRHLAQVEQERRQDERRPLQIRQLAERLMQLDVRRWKLNRTTEDPDQRAHYHAIAERLHACFYIPGLLAMQASNRAVTWYRTHTRDCAQGLIDPSESEIYQL